MSHTEEVIEPVASWQATQQPNEMCAAWCKCVTCREVDFDAYKAAEKDLRELSVFIATLEARIESLKALERHTEEITREYQDKYAGESMEDRARFVNGAKDEGTTILQDVTNALKED